MKRIHFIILGILIISSFACNKQDWEKEVNVPILLESDVNEEVSIKNDLFTVNQAQLVVSSITISGKRLQSDDVTINYNETINLDFLNPEQLNSAIKIPVGTYEELKATLTFSVDPDKSFINGNVVSNNGQGNSQALNIPLNFDEIHEISIINEQEETVVLIDESTKGFKITMSIQESFNNIDHPMWQGLMNANENQSQVDLTSLVGNNFQSSINTEIKSNIKLKVLN